MLKIQNLKNEIFGPVSLQIASGNSMVVSGPSGSGKTRFMRAICDLDQAEGEIYLNDQERQQMAASEWRTKIRYVPAESFWWHETVIEHFPEGFNLESMMQELDLNAKLINWSISRLSTGERQRLALIRSLADNPDVLLLDEPTSALDSQRTQLVENMINAQLENGKIILIASHSQSQSEKYGPDCIHFENGAAELCSLQEALDRNPNEEHS